MIERGQHQDGERRAGVRVGASSTAVAAILAWSSRAAAEGLAATAPSMFAPTAEPAIAIRDYSYLVIGICAAIFFVVFSLLIVTVVRFRARKGDDRREPPQIYGSDQLELAWTVVPLLIVILLGLVTTRHIVGLQPGAPGSDGLRVTVVGHQWWWELVYPDQGFTTANELHLVAGRVAELELASQDVIHSFWVPQLAGKTDVIPNRTNHMWIAPDRTGVFVGQCAEFCGTQHANMLLRVVVHSEEEFATWIAHQQALAVDAPSGRAGREIFEQTACVSCHTIRGTDAEGRFGPDLTHLMSRRTIGAGVAPNDRTSLQHWITRPDHFKPGALMPAMGLDEARIERVVDYLTTLE